MWMKKQFPMQFSIEVQVLEYERQNQFWPLYEMEQKCLEREEETELKFIS
jgi:hypothetical protein